MLKDVFARCWHTGVKASNNEFRLSEKSPLCFRLSAFVWMNQENTLLACGRFEGHDWGLGPSCQVRDKSEVQLSSCGRFGLSGAKKAEPVRASTCVHMSKL